MIVKWVQEWPDDIKTFRQECVPNEQAALMFMNELAGYGIRSWTENSLSNTAPPN